MYTSTVWPASFTPVWSANSCPRIETCAPAVGLSDACGTGVSELLGGGDSGLASLLDPALESTESVQVGGGFECGTDSRAACEDAYGEKLQRRKESARNHDPNPNSTDAKIWT